VLRGSPTTASGQTTCRLRVEGLNRSRAEANSGNSRRRGAKKAAAMTVDLFSTDLLRKLDHVVFRIPVRKAHAVSIRVNHHVDVVWIVNAA